MLLPFTKMQALGNDFVVLDGVSQALDLSPAQCQKLADRRLGVGCDQILIVTPPPSPTVDYGYRIVNADGSEVGQCGNGARALARYIAHAGLSAKPVLRVQTASTIMTLQQLDDGQVQVDLARPDFQPASLPFMQAQAERYTLRCDQQEVVGGAVSVGNPHFVMLVDDVDQAPVTTLGGELSRHPDFPEGANIGFAQVCSRDHIRLRVCERGVGETPACGSGACAAVAVLHAWDKIDARAMVDLPGGALELNWPDREAAMLMRGPASIVFEGEIQL